MAIPRKGSRSLEVAGRKYRWHIRRRAPRAASEYADPLTVAVERIEPPSQNILMLSAPFPRSDNYRGIESGSITPKIVADAIADAIAHGWDAGKAGSPFFHRIDEALTAPRNLSE